MGTGIVEEWKFQVSFMTMIPSSASFYSKNLNFEMTSIKHIFFWVEVVKGNNLVLTYIVSKFEYFADILFRNFTIRLDFQNVRSVENSEFYLN